MFHVYGEAAEENALGTILTVVFLLAMIIYINITEEDTQEEKAEAMMSSSSVVISSSSMHDASVCIPKNITIDELLAKLKCCSQCHTETKEKINKFPLTISR